MAVRDFTRRQLSPELTRLRLMATLAPIAFVVVVLYLMRGPFHHALHEYPGFLYVLAAVSMAVSLFSFVIFAVIGRLERRLRTQNRELTALNEIAAGSAEQLELERLLDLALGRVVETTGGDGGAICLLDDETGRPGRTHVHGRLSEEVPRLVESRLRDGLREDGSDTCAQAVAVSVSLSSPFPAM